MHRSIFLQILLALTILVCSAYVGFTYSSQPDREASERSLADNPTATEGTPAGSVVYPG